MLDYNEVVTTVVSFLLGLISAYFGLLWKVRKELEAEYDKDLRAKRLRAYGRLWTALQPLAKYSPERPLTAEGVLALSVSLRKWYFEVGGLFLTDLSRDAYFALQDALTASGADGRPDELRALGSRLRTATTIDVGSRKRPLTEEARDHA